MSKPKRSSVVCARCKGRLRTMFPERVKMHQECYLLTVEETQSAPPKEAPLTKTEFPPSRICPSCRRLDNSIVPAKRCRSCGVETVIAPDRVIDKGAPAPSVDAR